MKRPGKPKKQRPAKGGRRGKRTPEEGRKLAQAMQQIAQKKREAEGA